MLGGSCMIGWDNCCCGASTGRPCSIGLIYVWGRDILWLGIGCLKMGCGGYHLMGFVQRAEVGGCMDNHHAQVVEQANSPGGTSYSTLVCSSELGTLEWTSVLLLSVGYGNSHTLKPHYSKFRNMYTSTHKKSPHAYKLIPLDVVVVLKNLSARISCISLLILPCIFR